MEQKHFFSISRKPYVHKTHFPFTAPFYFKSLRYRRLMLENGTGNEAELILTIFFFKTFFIFLYIFYHFLFFPCFSLTYTPACSFFSHHPHPFLLS